VSVYNRQKENAIEAIAISGLVISLFSFIQMMRLAEQKNFFLAVLITTYISAFVGYFLYYKMHKASFYLLLFATVSSIICGTMIFTIPKLIFLNVLFFLFNGVAFGVMWQFKHVDYFQKIKIYKASTEIVDETNYYA
jgi:hypothetical protein